jgi:hypothetical protein
MSNGIGEEDDDTAKKKRKPIPKIDADRQVSLPSTNEHREEWG